VIFSSGFVWRTKFIRVTPNRRTTKRKQS
jgi:hypothetical protein